MEGKMDETVKFRVEKEADIDAKTILKQVSKALEEKGYNPINHLVGYILSGDPAYITSYNNARNLIRKLERDKLVEELIKSYIESE